MKTPAAVPPLRDFSRSLPMALLRSREQVMRRFRPWLSEHGLTEQQWRVIRVLAECGRLEAKAIAARTLVLAPSLSRILRALEARELIVRTTDKADQRVAQVSLSSDGHALYRRIAPGSEGIYAELAEAVGADRLERLYALLADFDRALGAEAAAGDGVDHEEA